LPVDKPDVIDIIGTQHGEGEVVLTISDHLEWDEANEGPDSSVRRHPLSARGAG
jgi:hypothetical protein